MAWSYSYDKCHLLLKPWVQTRYQLYSENRNENKQEATRTKEEFWRLKDDWEIPRFSRSGVHGDLWPRLGNLWRSRGLHSPLAVGTVGTIGLWRWRLCRLDAWQTTRLAPYSSWSLRIRVESYHWHKKQDSIKLWKQMLNLDLRLVLYSSANSEALLVVPVLRPMWEGCRDSALQCRSGEALNRELCRFWSTATDLATERPAGQYSHLPWPTQGRNQAEGALFRGFTASEYQAHWRWLFGKL